MGIFSNANKPSACDVVTRDFLCRNMTALKEASTGLCKEERKLKLSRACSRFWLVSLRIKSAKRATDSKLTQFRQRACHVARTSVHRVINTPFST